MPFPERQRLETPVHGDFDAFADKGAPPVTGRRPSWLRTSSAGPAWPWPSRPSSRRPCPSRPDRRTDGTETWQEAHGQRGQAEHFIEFSVRQQAGVGADPGPVEFELHRPVEAHARAFAAPWPRLRRASADRPLGRMGALRQARPEAFGVSAGATCPGGLCPRTPAPCRRPGRGRRCRRTS